MTRPLLLDLFCGAGGAAKGYHDAGFRPVGIDLWAQANYPYNFHRDDALVFLRWLLDRPDELARYDAIHASPPCQGYSAMSSCRPGLAGDYPRLIGPVRELLEQTGKPWVIENVPLARSDMREPVMLCGFMFGRELYRHRLFEANFPLTVPEHPEHTIPASRAGHWTPGTVMSVAGHVAPVALARQVMAMDWTTREELAEAIPPYYAEHVGLQLLAEVQRRNEVATVTAPRWPDLFGIDPDFTSSDDGPSAAERAWNEAHGLTDTCSVCGGATQPGRDPCTWACWRRQETLPAVADPSHKSGETA